MRMVALLVLSALAVGLVIGIAIGIDSAEILRGTGEAQNALPVE
jgi:hypothetical protein